MTRWKAKRRQRWRKLHWEIAEAASSIQGRGYCVATWQPQVVALAAPIITDRRPIYVLNVGVTTEAPLAMAVRGLERLLLARAAQLRQMIGEIGA